MTSVSGNMSWPNHREAPVSAASAIGHLDGEGESGLDLFVSSGLSGIQRPDIASYTTSKSMKDFE